MELIELTAKGYNQYFPKPHYIYNSVAFNELNATKVQSVRYFVFRDSKVRLGICFGEKDGVLKSPFSAPFGGFSYNSDGHKYKSVEKAVALLEDFAKTNGKDLKITLPPDFYGSTIINEVISSFTRLGYNASYVDMNYQFFCKDFANYESKLNQESRNKLRRALDFNYDFIKLDSALDSDVERAYNVIRANRKYRGFPLHMSLQAVLNTVKIIPADFFILTEEGKDVAAAQIFYVSDNVVQVIYWGDLPGFSVQKVMNLLAYKIFEFYATNTNVEIIDIGPSTELGRPNHGLCEFKENIGCKTALKFTFEMKYGGGV